jgi:hypothetical protein
LKRPVATVTFPGVSCTFDARLILCLGFDQFIYRLVGDEDGGQIALLLRTLAHVNCMSDS